MFNQEEFLAQIETFLEKHDISATAFGLLLMNDRSFVDDLRYGRNVRLDTAAKISEIISRPQAANLFGRQPLPKHKR